MACGGINCKESIFINEDSIIPVPVCQGDCPEDINCNGEVTYSDCIVVTKDLSCINITNGMTLTESLSAINDLACSSEGQGCSKWTELTKGNLGLATGWSWAGSGFEKPAVSDVKLCIVRLAGTISKNIVSAPQYSQVTIGILPVGKRPLNYRRYPIVVTTNGLYPFVSTMLTIAPTGEMTFLNLFPLTGVTTYTISIDGISFETNTII